MTEYERLLVELENRDDIEVDFDKTQNLPDVLPRTHDAHSGRHLSAANRRAGKSA